MESEEDSMAANMVGQTLQNRYRVEQPLGRGGMAEVYRAWDLKLNRPVAVKVLYPYFADDAEMVERLWREASAAAGLDHPNVVAVYDRDEDDGRPFLVLELVDGESLAQHLGRDGALPPERALAVAGDVLAALAHAHSRGLVHRDVKPGNVLLTSDDRAKLADFGIAQASENVTLTRPGDVLGTLAYLAPERLAGQAATPATDVYGVGAMLYQMLTGQPLFTGDLPAAIAAQHGQQVAPPPSALRPDLPEWLDQIVLKALARDPASRFPSAAAMLQAIADRRVEGLHAAPTARIVAPPVTPGQELGASTGLNRAGVLGVAHPPGGDIGASTARVPAGAVGLPRVVGRGARRGGRISGPVYALALVAVLLIAGLATLSVGALWGPTGDVEPAFAAVPEVPAAEPTSAPATAMPTPVPATATPPTATPAPTPVRVTAPPAPPPPANTVQSSGGSGDRDAAASADDQAPTKQPDQKDDDKKDDDKKDDKKNDAREKPGRGRDR
jgi:eukaryotic-like serine/threonine-protein kinase